MAPSATFHNLPPDKQRRIMEHALDEFAEKGYGRASMNSLVAALGIAKGSIFKYFTDKSGLFRHVFDFALGKVKDHLRQVRDASAGLPVFTRLRMSLLAGLDLIEEHPKLFGLYLRVLFEGDMPLKTRLLASVVEEGRDYIMELLMEGKRSGELDPELDLAMATFLVEAVLERFLVARSLDHLDPGLGLAGIDRGRAEELAGELVELLRLGLGREGRRPEALQ